jgi:hypothetical protein
VNSVFGSRARRRTVLAAALAAVLVLGLAACYPGGPESLGELNTVVTVKNPAGNHEGMRYYAMVDSVYEIKADDSSSEVLDRRYDATIIAEIQGQMSAAGFARVDTSAGDSIDAYVTVGSVVSEVWVYWYNWGYYPGYPGYPGYYPPSVGTASFEQGSVVWQLTDTREFKDPGNSDPKAVLNWAGGINGALNKTASTNEAGIRTGIRQGFAQSPYIKAAVSR